MTADEYETGESRSPSDRTESDDSVVRGDAGTDSVSAAPPSADLAVGRPRGTTDRAADDRVGEPLRTGDETQQLHATEATVHV